MSRWLRFLFGGVPLSETDAAVVRATLADWRHEVAGASRPRAFLTSLRYTVALTRVTAGLVFLDVVPALQSRFVRRVAFGTVALIYFGSLFEVEHAVVGRLGIAGASLLALAEAGPWMCIAMPLLAFVAEAVGGRDRTGPSLGGLLLWGIVVAAGTAFAFPAGLEHAWRVKTDLGYFVPFPAEIYGGGPRADLGLLFGAMAVTAPISAYRARQYGRWSGWVVALAPVLLVALWVGFAGLLLVATRYLRIDAQLLVTVLRISSELLGAALVIGPLVAAAWLTRRMKAVA
jgi:hypothetical protein